MTNVHWANFWVNVWMPILCARWFEAGEAAGAAVGAGKMQVLTVICSGLTKRKQLLALMHLLAQLEAGVRILTETHVRKRDLKRGNTPGHTAASGNRRRTRGCAWVGEW